MRLAADANALLSAILGGRAREVFGHPALSGILTVASVLSEVEEYIPMLAAKKRLDEQTLRMTLTSLPVTVVPSTEYGKSLPEARRRMAGRDPDDVELLALALAFDIPVWSNDNDFEVSGVDWYTTAQLLKRLASHPR